MMFAVDLLCSVDPLEKKKLMQYMLHHWMMYFVYCPKDLTKICP